MDDRVKITESDLFLAYGYGFKDENILYVTLDVDGKIHWVRDKALASEFTRSEVKKLVQDAQKKGIRVLTTKVA